VPERAFPRMRAGIETTVPLPWICTFRIAPANRDRADAHVTVEDVPAFIAGVVRSAAGKGGHAPMIPPIEPRGKPLQIAAVGLAHLGVEHMLRRSRRPHNTRFACGERSRGLRWVLYLLSHLVADRSDFGGHH